MPNCAIFIDETPLVTLDELTHVYTDRGGLHPPSVTQIISCVPPFMGRFDRVDPELLERKRQIGTMVHRATHYYDENTLDWQTVDPVLVPYLEAWKQFRAEKHFTPLLMETCVYHAAYGYAGTLDRVGTADTRAGESLALIDIKCGDGSMAGPQLAAYLEAWRDMIHAGALPMMARHAGAHVSRWSVQLRDNGTYDITTHESRRDWNFFKAALEIYTFCRSQRT